MPTKKKPSKPAKAKPVKTGRTRTATVRHRPFDDDSFGERMQKLIDLQSSIHAMLTEYADHWICAGILDEQLNPGLNDKVSSHPMIMSDPPGSATVRSMLATVCRNSGNFDDEPKSAKFFRRCLAQRIDLDDCHWVIIYNDLNTEQCVCLHSGDKVHPELLSRFGKWHVADDTQPDTKEHKDAAQSWFDEEED